MHENMYLLSSNWLMMATGRNVLENNEIYFMGSKLTPTYDDQSTKSMADLSGDPWKQGLSIGSVIDWLIC